MDIFGAAISGLGSLFGARSQKKAEKKAADERLKLMKLQREWDVEDRDMARKFELEDRTARQGLLNPYAKHFKGERIPETAGTDPAIAAKLPPTTGGERLREDQDYINGQYRMIR